MRFGLSEKVCWVLETCWAMHVFARLPAGATAQRAIAQVQPWLKALLEENLRLEAVPLLREGLRGAYVAPSNQSDSSPAPTRSATLSADGVSLPRARGATRAVLGAVRA